MPKGFIAQTRGINSTFFFESRDISETQPVFRIVDSAPLPALGTEIFKTGRTTGVTSGELVGTCVDVVINAPAGIVDDQGQPIQHFLPCQAVGTYRSQAGDSGGPVFIRTAPDSDDVFFLGLNHAEANAELDGNPIVVGIFSPVAAIEADFEQSLDVAAEPNARQPNPEVPVIPGLVSDELKQIFVDNTVFEFPVEVIQPGRMHIQLVSASTIDSRLVEVSMAMSLLL